MRLLPVAVVIELIVAGIGNVCAAPSSNGKEDLDCSVDPDLNKNCYVLISLRNNENYRDTLSN